MSDITISIDYKKAGLLNPAPIIQNINLEFPKESSTIIVGTSGAGKSTLIKCLLAQTRYRGKTDIDREKVAYIPQKVPLNERETVLELLEFTGMFHDPEEEIEVIHQRSEDLIKEFGLECVKHNKIKKLSGGQRQRVAICKELMRDKEIFILDEGDTGLDVGVSALLTDILVNLCAHGKTAIMISHNVLNIPKYDQLVIIAKDDNRVGGIAYAGPPEYAFSYFGRDSYVDIIKCLNSKDEGGYGQGTYYINKYNNIN